MNERGYLPATPFLATTGIGFVSGLFGPLSIVIGLGEAVVGYYMYKHRKGKWGAPLLAGGVIATFMGIGEVVWGGMFATGKTTTSSLEGWQKILMPSAYGFELLNKAFTPKIPSFTPTPETAVQTGVRTVW